MHRGSAAFFRVATRISPGISASLNRIAADAMPCWSVRVSSVRITKNSMMKNTRCQSVYSSERHIFSWGTTLRSPNVLQTSNYSSNTAQTTTIYALASGHGKSGVAVVRISGPGASKVIKEMIPSHVSSRIRSREAVLSVIKDPVSGEVIDNGLVLWFLGPNSFTGEDVCELQVHGGPAVITALYSALAKLEGFRMAEAGEFSKRAFYNGKLDLTEVEGLGDLIQAETEAQRRQAIRQMSGDLSKLYERWRHRLLRIVAHVEAYIDFSEDENIEEGVLEQAHHQVADLLSEIQCHLADKRRGERLRSGVHVTIAGRPNVGKSTLLNALCQRPAAIVSHIAGTTRDVVESTLNVGGFPVILSDTAGIRDTTDEVEKEGVRRARERTNLADLIIFMVDATSLSASKNSENIHHQINSQVQCSKLWAEESNFTSDGSDPEASNNRLSNEFGDERELVVIVNKTDLLDTETKKTLESVVGDGVVDLEKCLNEHELRHEGRKAFGILPMSCKTDDGMHYFLQWLTKKLAGMCSNPSSPDPYLTQERHRSHLMKCAHALQSFAGREDLVMAAEELRIALRQLGKITGHVTTEEILDVIFKDFCIGK